MGASVLQIYNRALNLVGTRSDLSGISELSREGELCRLWYGSIRQEVLAAAHWSCAKDVAELSLLASRDMDAWTAGQPMPPWYYAYGRPSSFIHPRYLTDYTSFEMARHGSENAVLTNSARPILVFTRDETETGLWDEVLVKSVYFGLAARLAYPLTGSRSKARALLEEANMQIMLSRQVDANVSVQNFESMPDWMIARGVSGPSNPNRYIYPVGALLVDNVG